MIIHSEIKMQNTGKTHYLTLEGKNVIIYSDNKYTKHDKLWCPCPVCDGNKYPKDVMEIIE